MADDRTSGENTLNAKMLAEKFVRYETQEKGVIGSLLGFEARDGFWSKLAKTINVPSMGLISGLVAFTGMGAAGGMAYAVAALSGLTSAAIYRALGKSVFSDMHDSQKSNLAKFGQYMGVSILGAVGIFSALILASPLLASSAATWAAVSLGLTNIVDPLIYFASSKIIASSFGDASLREESRRAREMAEQAVASGQSISPGVSRVQTTQRTDIAEPMRDESHAVESRKFREMVETRRADQREMELC